MTTIPDNYSQYEEYDRKQAEYERYLPKCDKCGEKCEGDYAYSFDGALICEACFEEWAEDCKIDLEEYVEDAKKEEW